MKRFCLVLCLAVFALLPVYANGLFIQPLSGLGNAGVAGTKNSVAIYYNPACLVNLNGSAVDFQLVYFKGAVKSNHSLKNNIISDMDNGDFPFPAVYNIPSIGLGVNFEPAEYGSKETPTKSFIPFTGGYTKIDDITLALGCYVAGGGSGKWEDTVKDAVAGVDSIHSLVDASFGFIIYNVSAAKEISRDFNIGLGLNLVSMQSISKVNKTYTKSDSSLLPAALGSYMFQLESDASGSGIEGVAGATYKLTDKVTTGVVIRSGTNIALKGKSKYIQSGLSALGAAYADLTIQSDYDQNYAYPVTMSAGMQCQATEKVLFAFAIDRNNYSVLKNNITYKAPVAGVFSNVDQNKKWEDVYQFHAGVEYKVDEKLSLRGGAQNDPLPFSRSKASIMNTNQFDFITLTIGAGYSIGSIQLEGTYMRTTSDKFDNGGRSFEYMVDAFQVGINYRFGTI